MGHLSQPQKPEYWEEKQSLVFYNKESDATTTMIVVIMFTCSVWPWGKYTTGLATGGSETKGPAQACHSSEFRHLLSASNRRAHMHIYMHSHH
jgi:hypothetical protein